MVKHTQTIRRQIGTKNILLQATSHEWFQKQSSKNP